MYRYDLGSGKKVLRSREPITLGRFHRLSAKRYGRDAILRLDVVVVVVVAVIVGVRAVLVQY